MPDPLEPPEPPGGLSTAIATSTMVAIADMAEGEATRDLTLEELCPHALDEVDCPACEHTQPDGSCKILEALRERRNWPKK